MTIQQLLYFTKLAETGHMGRTAEALYIAQPSLSIAMKNLEQEVGIRLFTHEGKRMELSEAGRAFYEHAKKILRDVEETEAHMKVYADEQAHLIRIGAVEPVFHEFLPARMSAFLQQEENRKIRFTLSCGPTPELVRGIKNGLYDLLLCSRTEDEEMEETPLLTQPFVFLCGEKEPVQLVSNKALEMCTLVGYDPGSAMDLALSRFANEQGITLQYDYRAPHEQAILSLVRRGLGCAVIPYSEDLDYTGVRLVPLPQGHYERSICLAVRRKAALTGAAGRFVAFLSSAVH